MNDATTPPVSPAEQQSMDEFLGAPAARPWYRNPRYIAGAVVIVVLVLLLARCFGGSAATGYATQEVRRDNLTVTVSATGNLLPTNEVEVGSEQS
ncbi:MAG: efflux RND transporter periplasmic adaptor subunit, partial [Sphingomonadales bacterium]